MKRSLLALGVFAFAVSAMAQSGANISSTNTSQSTWNKIKENASFTYYGEVYGRKFDDFSNHDREAIYSSLGLGYRVGKGRLTLSPRFKLYETTTTPDGETRGHAEMINPRFGYSQLLYKNDNFSIYNSSRLEFGINEAKTERNRLVKIKQYNAISFNLDKRNTLDIGLELSRWFYDGGKEEANAVGLGTYFEVIHKYAFTDKVALLSIFEIEHGFGIGDRSSLNFTKAGDYSIIKVGPEFSLGKKTSIYTAAFIDIDQGKKEIDTKNASLFISLSTAL